MKSKSVNQNEGKSGLLKKSFLASISFLTLVVILSFPVDQALLFLGNTTERWMNLALVIAMLYLLWFFTRRLPTPVALPLVIVALMCALTIRLTYLALVDFSGRGFGDEFFVHIDPESLRIAWYEYGRLIRRAAIIGLLTMMCGVVWYFAAISPNTNGKKLRSSFATSMLALLCAVYLVSARNQMPEWQMLTAWAEWHIQGQSAASTPVALVSMKGQAHNQSGGVKRLPDSIDPWVRSGLLSVPPVASGEIRAEAPAQPTNLILLYVEALTTSIIEHDDYEDLMPGFRYLLENNSFVDDFYASSHVTIEGVANTQCGLLFPFRGHGGFAGRTMLAEALPCLGDVLASAGYHQSYVLGGGPMSFTGKGDFLASHGFNDLRGWEYWRSRGFERSPGHWGLGDIETLEQVKKLIIERRKIGQAFNITALTVGSHIPGYSYPECSEYPSAEDRYLDALHCADQVISEWVEDLESEGLLEDTLVVIVGDHPVFSNPDTSRLFGSAMEDPRIPFIVLGEELPEALHERGAGYDLAPTILDLLNIEHNASFAMGRSLLEDHDRPDYFINRRFDVHQGEVVVPAGEDCGPKFSDMSPVSPLPLTQCSKRSLMTAIRALTLAYSNEPGPLECEHPAFLDVKVPVHDVGPISLIINGRQWSSRFSWRGRIAHPNDNGLFALTFSSTGQPEERVFIPEAVLQSQFEEDFLSGSQQSEFVLFAWRPSKVQEIDLSLAFPLLPNEQSKPGIWLARASDGLVLSGESVRHGFVLKPSREECYGLLKLSDTSVTP